MDFILNPFVTILTLLYSIFNQDMVLAIIVFTALIRLLTYPLTAQQMKSSKAMQVVQPELKKLQEKYKNDREKLAAEQMRLYRENGVNPVGGCLPLLIQFPILIALYQAVIHALAASPLSLIDLSGRLLIPGLGDVIPLENRWMGMNLSLPPDMTTGSIIAYALPVLVVITTWLQFKVTTPPMPPSEDGKPNAAASTQQTMGTVMPLMYGFFALSFSVGLSIYFIASNVIGIAQYVLMGKADFRNILPFGLGRTQTAAPALTTPTPTRRDISKGGSSTPPKDSAKPSGGGKPRR
ncbi:MAG: YidC/Oxa1 family membrane protein insertase [Anaerolineae bacterium]|nr:YidC/Oxa1 family membrane protein insertase [Anaerolineae bacterium]NUQ02295.1 YidC/Oxa1 family membrane protein insertase [Anaerolineae bacterium]